MRTRSEYLRRRAYLERHADSAAWTSLLRAANEARRHAASCPHPHDELRLRTIPLSVQIKTKGG